MQLVFFQPKTRRVYLTALGSEKVKTMGAEKFGQEVRPETGFPGGVNWMEAQRREVRAHLGRETGAAS